MGLPESPWDNSSFPSMGDITCGTIACTNWPRANLRQIGYTVYVFTDLYINTALVVNPNVNLMGPFTSTDANVEPLCVHNKIYLPTPFFRLFLERDLTPMEAWTRFCGVIADGGLEADCLPIFDWLHVFLTLKTGNENLPLAMLHPTTPHSWQMETSSGTGITCSPATSPGCTPT